ncbi:MAG: DMT family transporter [Alphaproteobacteria bacterium]
MDKTYTAQENIRGGMYVAIAMLGFLANDSLIKYVTTDLYIGQIIFLRGSFASLFLFLLCLRTNALLPPRQIGNKLFAFRAGLEAFATITFLTALVHLPLSNISAILQALPLAVTLGAALLLGEKIGWRRITAILVGFFGVLLIIQPGFGDFSFYSILVILSVLAAAGRDLVTRKMPENVPSLFISLYTSIVITCMGAVMTVLHGWESVSWLVLAYIAAASIFIIVGYFFIIAGMRVGETGFVTPFRYTVLIWALLVGYVAFDEVPNTLMLIGSAIVVGMGLYAFHRERTLAKQG